MIKKQNIMSTVQSPQEITTIQAANKECRDQQ